ncbi:MAG: SPOR domain-containing protein [Bacteroidales bacterium]|jgi:cell division protein FtsN|nr:SPOR domain-containing protein [Bacteroidales bacterium]
MAQPVKPKPASKSNNGATIAIIVIALLVIAAVAVYFLVYAPSQQKMPPPAPPVVADTTDIEPPDTLIAESIPEVVDQFIETIDNEPVAVRYDSDANIERGFYIIAGSYRSKRNAEKFAEKLSKDIDCKILFFESSGLYRVSCGKYGNIHTAYNDRISIRDLEGCSEAWILENR